MWSQFNAFLLAFVVIGYGQSSATYLKYEIGSEFCSNSDIQIRNDPAFNTSIILESSDVMPKTCAVRITTLSQVDGLMVTVLNLSMSNGLNNSCDNSIEFDSLPSIQWCDSTDAKTLVFENSILGIAFNSSSNNSLSFKLVITPFEKPVSGVECLDSVPFSCQSPEPLNCISNIFHCDGVVNCPNGTDEKECPQISRPEIISQSSEVNEPLPQNSDYNIYNVRDYCGKATVIEIKANINGSIPPAILQLSADDSKHINQTDCPLRLESAEKLVVGIDYISIGSNNNKTCDDFIEIDKSIKWCKNNKTDDIGISLNRNGDIDFNFHAGSDSNSSFRLIITPYEAPLLKRWCPSGNNLKCSSSQNECVSKKFLCDDHRNCPNGEDEKNCPKPPPPPTTTTTPSPPTTTSTTMAPPHPTTTTRPTTTIGTSTSTDPAPSPSPTPSPSHSLKPGIIALIVIGTLLGVIIVVVGGFWCIKRRRDNVGYNALN